MEPSEAEELFLLMHERDDEVSDLSEDDLQSSGDEGLPSDEES